MLARKPLRASSGCCAPSPAYLEPRPPTLRLLACRLRDFRSLFKAGAAPFGASDKGAIYQKRLKTHKPCKQKQALRLFTSPHSRFYITPFVM